MQLTTICLQPRTDRPPDCPFCWDPVPTGEACPECGVRYHPACSAALSRCAVLGCPGKLGRGARRRPGGRLPKRWRVLLAGALRIGIATVVALVVLPAWIELGSVAGLGPSNVPLDETDADLSPPAPSGRDVVEDGSQEGVEHIGIGR